MHCKKRKIILILKNSKFGYFGKKKSPKIKKNFSLFLNFEILKAKFILKAVYEKFERERQNLNKTLFQLKNIKTFN